MVEVVKAKLYYDDGTTKEVEGWKSFKATLQMMNDELYSLQDVKAWLQKPLGKFDGSLGVCYSYLVNGLQIDESTASNVIDAWCQEWAVNNTLEEWDERNKKNEK